MQKRQYALDRLGLANDIRGLVPVLAEQVRRRRKIPFSNPGARRTLQPRAVQTRSARPLTFGWRAGRGLAGATLGPHPETGSARLGSSLPGP